MITCNISLETPYCELWTFLRGTKRDFWKETEPIICVFLCVAYYSECFSEIDLCANRNEHLHISETKKTHVSLFYSILQWDCKIIHQIATLLIIITLLLPALLHHDVEQLQYLMSLTPLYCLRFQSWKKGYIQLHTHKYLKYI